MRRAEVPLIEREPEDIRRALGAYLGLDPEQVRVTKLQLAEGREVAYIRVIWPRAAWRTSNEDAGRRGRRPLQPPAGGTDRKEMTK